MNKDLELTAVHRDEDDELVGYLTAETRDGAPVSVARTVFGAELKTFVEQSAAVAYLERHGLSILAEKWWYRSAPADRWVLTFLVEARLGSVLVRFGYDPSSTNTATLTGSELANLRPEHLH